MLASKCYIEDTTFRKMFPKALDLNGFPHMSMYIHTIKLNTEENVSCVHQHKKVFQSRLIVSIQE